MPKFGNLTITHFMHCSPFEQVFDFVEAFPKLRTLCVLRFKKITFPHVFGSKQSYPDHVFLLIHFRDPFGHQAFVKDLCVHNTQAYKFFRSTSIFPFNHMVFEIPSCTSPEEP
jgi:hypothetical protein